RAKHGHMLFPGRALTGRLVVADIGILPDWDGAQGVDVLEEEDARALLPSRAPDAHKGTNGHVLSVAGSEGMAGAACLCAKAALRAGAGLVTAACPLPVLLPVQNAVPCAMAKAVCDGAQLGANAVQRLLALAKGKRALAIGPGLGQSEGVFRAIEPLIKCGLPKVVDADALNLLAAYGSKVGDNTVLTPHPGEMARLMKCGVEEVVASPVDMAQRLASDTGACVLLKGATTVIAQGEDVAFNVTGANGMGTGGCGDVLTGVIAGLLAQGMSPMDAARAGAYYHGRAGERAQQELGARAVTAMDVCDRLRIE
ncbi:MAG: NAD(P)H-hydrate dehydratase, partial [Clostridia bacterium]|nr:NAD(P)H-hydrate dehydratase [Clostridia bacterium]